MTLSSNLCLILPGLLETGAIREFERIGVMGVKGLRIQLIVPESEPYTKPEPEFESKTKSEPDVWSQPGPESLLGSRPRSKPVPDPETEPQSHTDRCLESAPQNNFSATTGWVSIVGRGQFNFTFLIKSV